LIVQKSRAVVTLSELGNCCFSFLVQLKDSPKLILNHNINKKATREKKEKRERYDICAHDSHTPKKSTHAHPEINGSSRFGGPIAYI
jgi:hypothetical protein